MRYCHGCGIDLTTIRIPVVQKPQQHLQPPQVAYKPHPKRAIVALIFAIVTVILLILSGVFPWWSIARENGSETTDFTLHEAIVESRWGNEKRDLESISIELNSVAETTYNILLLSTILMVLVAVFLGIMIWLFYSGILGNIRMFNFLLHLLPVFALIFILVAAIYYAIAWPVEMGESSDGRFDTFIGSSRQDGIDRSWGPGMGWILTFACFLLISFTLIFTIQGFKEIKALIPKDLPAEEFEIIS
jgi:hypothetical protein